MSGHAGRRWSDQDDDCETNMRCHRRRVIADDKLLCRRLRQLRLSDDPRGAPRDIATRLSTA